MRMEIKPLQDNVVVEPSPKQDKTESGLFLPEMSQDRGLQTGTVIEIGTGKQLENGEYPDVEVIPTNVVLYSKYAGNEYKMGDKTYRIIKLSDVLAILK
jgi:chaperonin GroES